MTDSVPQLPANATSSDVPLDPFQVVAGRGQNSQGISLTTFLVSLAGAAAIFGIECALFLLLKDKLKRI